MFGPNPFHQVLMEELKVADFTKIARLVSGYLRRSLSARVFYYPTVENFMVNGINLSGMKFFVGGKALRLNWKVNSVRQNAALHSMDYWDGKRMPQPNPSHHIDFDTAQSVVRVLPMIRDFLKQPKIGMGKNLIFSDDENARFSEINEGITSIEDVRGTVRNMLIALSQGVSIGEQSRQGGNKKYGPKWVQAQDAAKRLYPQFFAKSGKNLIVDPSNVDKMDPEKILAAIVGTGEAIPFSVSPGRKETVDVGVTEEEADRMSYEEQLDALKTGMKLLMSNATNALFLGGRGGTGKTQTVEDMLERAGLQDGEGYFKITGSATPVGIYRLLHTHRNDILLFDDSDSALADQEGRNLFKAASDTKKVRKISWQKGGKNFVSPEDYDEDSSDSDLLPRQFEFRGKIIFISNLTLDKLDPDGALRTRGYVISIDPTNQEIYDYMEKIVMKIPLEVDHQLSRDERMEVIEVLRQRKIPDKRANLRSLVRALNTRAGVEQQGGGDVEWRKFVKMFA